MQKPADSGKEWSIGSGMWVANCSPLHLRKPQLPTKAFIPGVRSSIFGVWLFPENLARKDFKVLLVARCWMPSIFLKAPPAPFAWMGSENIQEALSTWQNQTITYPVLHSSPADGGFLEYTGKEQIPLCPLATQSPQPPPFWGQYWHFWLP